MRALILLLLVAVAFLLIVKFYPTSTVEGGVGDQAGGLPAQTEPVREAGAELPEATPGAARFLTRPGSQAAALELPTEEPATPELAAQPQAREPRATTPAWLEQVEVPLVRDETELRIASVLVHGTVADLQDAIRGAEGFPAARALAAEAFATALEGKPREGLRIASGIDDGELGAREKELLQGALGAKPVRARPASASGGNPLVLAMEMRLAAAQGTALLAGGRPAEAVRALSDLLLRELAAPWPADPISMATWTEDLNAAQRQHRWSRRGEWDAVEMTVQPGDSLIAIRKRYVAAYPGRVMCVGLMRRANGIHENGTIQPGQVIRIPSEPVRMLVDLSSRRALYLIGEEVAGSWPIGIGKPGEETPVGDYVTQDKIPNPPWMKVGQEPIPFGDPRNPLGARWIGWHQDGFKTSYGFHGTIDPGSIGKASSDGCVRFRNEDVELLFEILPEGATVLVRE